MNRVLPSLLVLLSAASLAAAQMDSGSKVRVKRAVLEQQTVVLDLRIEPSWHIYAVNGDPSAGNVTRVAVERPFEIAGPVTEPKPHHVKKDYKDEKTGEILYTEEYDSHEGEITLRVPVRGSGSGPVKGSLNITACDANVCLQPGKVTFRAEAGGGPSAGPDSRTATPAPPAPETRTAPVQAAPETRTASRPARKVVENPKRLGKFAADDPFKVVEISYPDPIVTERFDVRVVVEIGSGYHVYGLAKEMTGVPTSVKLSKPAEDAAIVLERAGEIRADPSPKHRKKEFEDYHYFEGRVVFDVPVSARWASGKRPDAQGEVPFPFRLAVDYQTCTMDFCLVPGAAEFDLVGNARVDGLAATAPRPLATGSNGHRAADPAAVSVELSFDPPTLEPNSEAKLMVRMKRLDGRPISIENAEPRIDLAQAQNLFVEGTVVASAEPDGSVLLLLPVRVSLEAAEGAIAVSGRAAIGAISGPFSGEVKILSPLLGFLIVAALAALGALLTPCVFPMIPVTISIFTKQAEAGNAHPAKLGLLYCIGIVASFTAIGAIFTAVLKGDAANVFATHWLTQLVIAGLFVFFALSLLGMFDLAVPQPIMRMVERTTTTRLTAVSEGKGASVTVLLMGLLFAITTFTCTAPFIGGLLAGASASGKWTRPIFGMVAFSAVLAIPFFFLAVFPSQLKKLPKAGGWLNETKVVMGFIELSAAVKFLNGADLSLGWEIFTRNVCIAMWVAIFGLTGLYLIGVFRLPKDMPRQKTAVLALLLSAVFLTVSIYLTTGLNGKPLGKFIEGWLPPVEEVYLVAEEHTQLIAEGRLPTKTGYDHRFKDDFDAAVAEAKKLNVPLFVDFTGFT